MIVNEYIENSNSLVTSKKDTRAGFIKMALEKNCLAVPYIEEAKALKHLANKVETPKELKSNFEIRKSIISASGLSDKALVHMNTSDINEAIDMLIEKFLEPAGKYFVDELVYRYLLVKGDALGGKARNLAGSLGEGKFLRTVLSLFNISSIDYFWFDIENKKWKSKPENDSGIEKNIKAISWTKNNNNRILLLNVNVPIVNKNVDLCLLNGRTDELYFSGVNSKNSIHRDSTKYLCLGELKGGIDPAGADEHWKTANSALNRIRESFSKISLTPSVFFVGAAIQQSMATEIYSQLSDNILSNAANLHNEDQLINLCNWLLDI